MTKRIFIFIAAIVLLLNQTPGSSKVLSSPVKNTKKSIKSINSYDNFYFEENKGQLDDNSDFILKGNNTLSSFDKSGTIFYLSDKSKTIPVKLKFLNTNETSNVIGLEKLSAKANYLISNDRKSWKTNLNLFKKIKYENIYNGIDLVYYGNENKLEYDFVVKPFSDPSKIILSFDGTDSLKIKDGILTIFKDGRELVFNKPFIYQTINGIKKQVQGNYVLKPSNSIAFKVDNYDKTKELIIDPVLLFSTFIGGASSDSTRAVAADNKGNVYVGGQTSNLSGNKIPQDAMGSYVFIRKYDLNGKLVYSLLIGGSGYQAIHDIAVDSQGKVFITGYTSSQNFPTTNGVIKALSNNLLTSSSDGFVCKLNSEGNAFEYSTLLTGNNEDFPNGIAIDSTGNAYITGYTLSQDFPITNPAIQSKPPAILDVDAFLTKINPTGTKIIFSTFLGGSFLDLTHKIALDAQNNIYIVGYTHSEDFAGTVSTAPLKNGLESSAIFVIKIKANGGQILYTKYLGNVKYPSYFDICVDSDGNAYITGSTSLVSGGINDDYIPITTGAFQVLAKAGLSDGFVIKLNPTGNLIYGTFLGGSFRDQPKSISVDADGQATVTGFTANNNPLQANNFPLTSGQMVGIGKYAFVSTLNSTGSKLIESFLVSDTLSATDEGTAVTIDSSNNIYVVGNTSNDQFITLNPDQKDFGGDIDGFLAKFQGIIPPLVSPIAASRLKNLIVDTLGGIKDDVKELSSSSKDGKAIGRDFNRAIKGINTNLRGQRSTDIDTVLSLFNNLDLLTTKVSSNTCSLEGKNRISDVNVSKPIDVNTVKPKCIPEDVVNSFLENTSENISTLFDIVNSEVLKVSCTKDEDCNFGEECDDDDKECVQAVECLSDIDCSDDETCDLQSQTCIPQPENKCFIDQDCGDSNLVCDTVTQSCQLASKTECSSDENCPEDKVCDSSLSICVKKTIFGCTSDRDCTITGQVCDLKSTFCVNKLQKIGCTSDDDCAGITPVCDSENNICIPLVTIECQSNNDCFPLTPICESGGCIPAPKTSCTGAADCASTNQICDLNTGTCVSPAP